MSSVPTAKNRIKSTAAYITAAVLLIVFTLLCRKLDLAFFYECGPFKPAEMTLNALIIASAFVFIFRHKGKGLVKKIGKNVIFALIPIALLITAFFYLPDDAMTAKDGAVQILYMLLSAFAEDFVVCTLGCILLIHISNMKTPGIIIMLLFSAAYGAVVREDHWSPYLWILTAVIIGFFVIQLHLSTDSAVFCGIIHFLLHMAMHFTAENSSQEEPLVRDTVAAILFTASLLSMVIIGIYLDLKRKIR